MSFLSKFERFFVEVKQNRWILIFSIFCRVSLAVGFLAAGYVKIIDERFANGLSIIHPMGSYLEALHHTGYYYTFIGIAQILAAILLLIPRTVFLGALLYFPIILNIWILSLAVRFEGSALTAPLMVLANLFLLCWNYDRLKFLLPIKHPQPVFLPKPIKYTNKFPLKFFFLSTAAFILTIAAVVAVNYLSIMPRNSISHCEEQFRGTNKTAAGAEFCNCVHNEGHPLNTCLTNFEKAAVDQASEN